MEWSVDRNLSTSSFNWPKAFLPALSVWVLANLAVWIMVEQQVLDPARSSENLRQIKIARQESGYFIVIGNSTATRIDLGILSREVPAFGGKKGLSLAVRGGLPRTLRFFLEGSDYRCVEKGGAALFFIAPMDLNRNNQTFRWTIRDLFSWKDFFKELLLRGRFLEATYFLQRASQPLVKYQIALNDFLTRCIKNDVPEGEGSSAVIDRSKASAEKIRDSMAAYRERYLVDYEIDGYQTDSVLRILEELKKRKVRTVIALPPFSNVLRPLIKSDDLKAYVKTARFLAEQSGVGFLDYVSAYDGTEYAYYDGSHLTDASVLSFSRRLAKDLKRT